jgi:hypothetical protein
VSTAVAMQEADYQGTYFYAMVEMLLDFNNGNSASYVFRAELL